MAKKGPMHICIYMYRCTYTSYCIIQHCTVLYFCKTLILQYRILSCRVLCIYYWCTWAVLSHLWCADRTELCCTVLFGLHSTSRDSTELSWIILQPTTVLCSTALCTYSDTMLWGTALCCIELCWAHYVMMHGMTVRMMWHMMLWCNTWHCTVICHTMYSEQWTVSGLQCTADHTEQSQEARVT